MADISMIGAGSWGIALAVLLYKNGHRVTVWSAIEAEIRMLQKEHEYKDKLPGVKLPEDMEFTTDLEQAVGRARLLRCDATVNLFSNFPLRQAILKESEYDRE